MRGLLAAVAVVALAGCGKQLNPAYCASHETDPDCRDAGLARIDAPALCQSDNDCTMAGALACDRSNGRCVECTTANTVACKNPTPVCYTRTDSCVGCVGGSDCASGVCLPDQTCATGTVIYAAPAGSGTACSMVSPCSFMVALTKVDNPTGGTISLAPGTYSIAPFAIARGSVVISGLGGTGLGPQAMTVLQSAVTGPVVAVSGNATLQLDSLTVTGSPDNDGITCNTATLKLVHVTSAGNAGVGLSTTNCTVSASGSRFESNASGGLQLADSMIDFVNNWIDNNGNGNGGQTGVVLSGATKGALRFSTIAYNQAHNGFGFGGLICNQANPVDASYNIIVANSNGQLSDQNQICTPTAQSYINGSAAAVMFVSPTDLHLTSGTLSPQILNNSNVNGNGVLVDIDDDMRPQQQFYDVGGDEL